MNSAIFSKTRSAIKYTAGFLLLLLCSVPLTAQVQSKYPTLFGSYPEEVVNAYATGNPKTTIAALESNLASYESANKEDFFLLANYRLFLAHIYEIIYKHDAAVSHYRKADEYLSKASFLTRDVLENILTAMQSTSDTAMLKNIPVLKAKLDAKDDWQKMRRAFLNYVELGQYGDAEAKTKGEDLIMQLGKNPFIEKRNLYSLRQTSATAAAGAISISLKTLHPNQVEFSHDYYMPYLKNMQVYSITVKNNSSSLMVLNSDDFILKSGNDSVVSTEKDKMPDFVPNTLAIEQFVFPELNPVTVSDKPAMNFNREIISANVNAFIQIEQAKKEAWLAKLEADRANSWSNVIGSGLSGISTGILQGVDQASASSLMNDASTLRSKGQYMKANYKETEAKSILADIEYQKKQQAANDARQQQQIADLKAKASGKESEANMLTLMAANSMLSDWNKSLSKQSTNFEYFKANERNFSKLEVFSLSSVFLPKRGSLIKESQQNMSVGEMLNALNNNSSNEQVQEDLGAAVRIKPGETWKGIICFDVKNHPLGSGNMKIHYRLGYDSKKLSLTLPMEATSTYVFTPPKLDFEQVWVTKSGSWGSTHIGSGSYGWGYVYNWYSLFPKLKPFGN